MYFRFVSSNWLGVFVFVPVVSLLTLIVIACYAPESPVYLLTLGQNEQAKQSLLAIARKNHIDLKYEQLDFIDEHNQCTNSPMNT